MRSKFDRNGVFPLDGGRSDGRQCSELLASLCEPSGMHREGEKRPVFGGVFQLCFQCASFGDLRGNSFGLNGVTRLCSPGGLSNLT